MPFRMVMRPCLATEWEQGTKAGRATFRVGFVAHALGAMDGDGLRKQVVRKGALAAVHSLDGVHDGLFDGGLSGGLHLFKVCLVHGFDLLL